MTTEQLTTYYIAGIQRDGTTRSECSWGTFAEAKAILDRWIARHKAGDVFYPRLVVATIANTKGIVHVFVNAEIADALPEGTNGIDHVCNALLDATDVDALDVESRDGLHRLRLVATEDEADALLEDNDQ